MSTFMPCKCPICGSDDTLSKRVENADTRIYDCTHCGPFEITGNALYEIAGMLRRDRLAWLEAARQGSTFERPVPLITLGQMRPAA